ncbi:MAG TPA: ribosome-recycling factor [Candidatus Paceibacterota bacterium]
MDNFSKKLKDKLRVVGDRLTGDFNTIRTGRATPAVLDTVNVMLYGSSNKISHVAAVSTEDAKTLRIAPWDKGALKPIESAIQGVNLGVSVVVDGEGIRVIFPDLTTDRRKLLEKLVGEKHEEARIGVKREREEILNELTKLERDGEITLDEKRRVKEDIQKAVDEFHSLLEAQVEKKLKEVRE